MKQQQNRHGLHAALLLALSALAVAGCGKQEEPAAEAPAAAAAPTGVAYVTNQDGGVSVIDLATLQVSKTIAIEAGSPRGLGITDDGRTLITANRDGGNIALIDTATGNLVKHVAIGKNPEFVRVLGEKAYISYEPSSKGGPPPAPGTEVEEEEEGDEPEESARIAVVDIAKGEVVQEIVGGPETEGIEFSADGKQLVITNEADNTITVHDLASGQLLKTIPTAEYGDRPRGIKVAPDGMSYVATLEYGNKFMVLDKDFNVVRTVDTGKTPYGIAFSRDGSRLFVAAAKEEALQVFDAKSYEKIKDVPTGKRCWHFTFTPDDKQILLACGRSDEVVVIDADKLEVVSRIGDKAMPWGIVAYPRSMGSLDRP